MYVWIGFRWINFVWTKTFEAKIKKNSWWLYVVRVNWMKWHRCLFGFKGKRKSKKFLFFFVCWPFLKSFCFAFCFWSILDPPVFTRKPKDQYVRAVNDEVSISCDGTGQPKPNIYWRKVSNIKIFIWIYHMKWRRTCTNKHKHKQWRILFVRN